MDKAELEKKYKLNRITIIGGLATGILLTILFLYISFVFQTVIFIPVILFCIIFSLPFYFLLKRAGKKPIKSRQIQYNISIKELFYILFEKKISPCCSAKMKRIERREKIREGKIDFNDNLEPHGNIYTSSKYYGYGETYDASIRYVCSKCGKEYKLNEIVSK